MFEKQDRVEGEDRIARKMPAEVRGVGVMEIGLFLQGFPA